MFRFFHQRNREVSPAAKPAHALLPAGTLVSKEDIYRENKGMTPILLLRKGLEVSPDELPRLIRNGARAHQFLFKPAESHEVATLPSPASLPHQLKSHRRHDLIEELRPTPPLAYQPLAADPLQKKRVLILEPDQKSLKRLIDCLFICGTSLDRIHTVRIQDHLAWALDKYQPQILIVDYALPNQKTGLELLANFTALPGIEKIIFTLAPDAPLTAAEIETLETFCPEKNIRILKKPVSRFTVSRILAE
jgi:hypothetical protein